MATIKLNDVRKTYPGGVEAVKGVSIDVPNGAMCVLVGPSGCGKSTLLRMVAGLETITDGTVMIDDQVVNQKEPAERDIAMVFQNYALYPHMKVYDNMAYGLRNRGMARDEIESRVQEAARILELTPLLTRRPRELSGGQRQRVAMGRAIVRSPKVFLFDEPLSNLDAKLRGQMRVEIRNLQKRFGVTSIYVTHDQVEAMTLADILVVMNNGLAEQIGTSLEIYSKPASTFVASFIGSPAMNLVDAVVDGSGKKLSAGGASITLSGPGLPPAGTTVTLGVRPEHFRLSKGRGDLLLAVDAVEVLGADTLAYGHVEGSDERTSPVVVRLPGNAKVAGGDMLALTIDPGMAHLFDRETGRRIEMQAQEKPDVDASQPLDA